MAAYVQSAQSGINFGNTSWSLAFGSNNTPGNLLVCAVLAHVNAGSPTLYLPTDTAGGGSGNQWYQAVTLADIAPTFTDVGAIGIFYTYGCIGGANTVTATWSAGGYSEIWIAEYSGLRVSNPLDVAESNYADSTHNPGFPTTVTLPGLAQGDLIVALSGSYNGQSTAGSGYTLRSVTDGTAAIYIDSNGSVPAGSTVVTTGPTDANSFAIVSAAFLLPSAQQPGPPGGPKTLVAAGTGW